MQRRPNMPESRPASLALPALRGSLIAALVALAAPVHAEEPASDARWVSDSLSTYAVSYTHLTLPTKA